MTQCVKNAAMKSGRNLARARNQGAGYAKGGMIPMKTAAVAAPKKPKKAGAMPFPPFMKKGK